MLVGLAVGWLPGSTLDVFEMLGVIAVSFIVMAVLLLRVVPRERLVPARASRSALILGIVSIVAVYAYWTGVPFAIAAAAIALGLSQRESGASGQDRVMAMAAVALGVLSVVASFVILLPIG